ncbi:hypothetical protein [Roseibium sp.]|uniref:hypothetical protein n=1 Tax=Roseibium sp. TaxID=1936156 RepID=UPI003BA8FCF1
MPVGLIRTLVFAVSLLPLCAWGQEHAHGKAAAPYAGMQERQIKSLSERDVEELRQGRGWGLALPAELNGHPGPVHLLELKDELALTPEQVDTIAQIFEDMTSDAIAAGERLILAEAALSDAFAGKRPDTKRLRELLADAAQARAELRFIHLSRHLSTPALLSQDQIETYNLLRGYASDRCSAVPEGHDPDMWHRHNGCE